MDECPVCGEELHEDDEQIVTRHNSEEFRFCSTDHRDEFEDRPGEYV